MIGPLRVRRYRWVLGAQLLSSVGTWVQAVVAPWLVLGWTGSATWTAAVAAAGFAPPLVLAPVAGRLADGPSRRRVVVAAHTTTAVTSAALAAAVASGVAGPRLLVGAALLLGCLGALSHPSYLSLVPDYVGPRLVPEAVALEAAAFNVAKVLGPLVGGVLVSSGQVTAAFLVNAVAFLAAAVTVLLAGEPTRQASVSGALQEGLVEGRQHVRVLLLFAVFGMAVQSVAPVLVERDLDEGGQLYGRLVALFALGGVVALPVVPWLRRRLPPGRETAAGIGVLGLGHALVAGGAAAGSSGLVALGMPLCGLAWIWVYGSVQSVLQTRTPAERRGRVLARYARAGIGGVAAGALAAGAAADHAPVWVVLTASSALLLLLAARTRLADLGGVVADDPRYDGACRPGRESARLQQAG